MIGPPLSRSERRPIGELLDRIEAYVLRHGKLPAALYLELRQDVEESTKVLEAAERGLADAERIIEARGRPGNWVGSLILNRVRRGLAGDLEPNSQIDAITLGDRIRADG